MREGMITFPGDPPFRIETFFETRKGDPFNLALLHMGTHLGTHVDPPAHYLEGGATVDQVPLDVLVGPGVLLDLRGHQPQDTGKCPHWGRPARFVQDGQRNLARGPSLSRGFHGAYRGRGPLPGEAGCTACGNRLPVHRAIHEPGGARPSNTTWGGGPGGGRGSWWWKVSTCGEYRLGPTRFSACPCASRVPTGRRPGSSCEGRRNRGE